MSWMLAYSVSFTCHKWSTVSVSLRFILMCFFNYAIYCSIRPYRCACCSKCSLDEDRL